MDTICGYIVVRLPSFNRDEAGRGAYSDKAPKVGDIYYGGVDRMPWFDIDEDFYAGTLPSGMLAARAKVNKENEGNATGVSVCSDLAVVRLILNYSNRNEVKNEIIAVRSTKFAEIVGRSVEYADGDIIWKGFDYVELGYWSLLAGGPFTNPSKFSAWIPLINTCGLMTEQSLLSKFVNEYKIIAARGEVEDIPGFVFGSDAVEIGHVLQ